jgi:4a-hydroxytetrahydrobiopterin dehydratase
VNENGTPKLNRSWKVKSFTKGLELFKLVGNVAEAEGMLLLLVDLTVV